jgi:hypothetical protein
VTCTLLPLIPVDEVEYLQVFRLLDDGRGKVVRQYIPYHWDAVDTDYDYLAQRVGGGTFWVQARGKSGRLHGAGVSLEIAGEPLEFPPSTVKPEPPAPMVYATIDPAEGKMPMMPGMEPSTQFMLWFMAQQGNATMQAVSKLAEAAREDSRNMVRAAGEMAQGFSGGNSGALQAVATSLQGIITAQQSRISFLEGEVSRLQQGLVTATRETAEARGLHPPAGPTALEIAGRIAEKLIEVVGPDVAKAVLGDSLWEQLRPRATVAGSVAE